MTTPAYRLTDPFLAIMPCHDITPLAKGVTLTVADANASTWRDEAIKEYRAKMRLGTAGGTAYISVTGILANCDAATANTFGLCSTQELLSAIRDSSFSPDAERICLIIDSPGGESKGITDVVDALRSGGKDTLAVADGNCASAAYWIAAACGKIAAKRSSVIGAIGVYLAFNNETEKNAKAGITTEMFTTGPVKAVGHPTVETTDAQRAFMQSHVNALFAQFKADVTKGRKISDDSMDGGFWLAPEARRRGLIDAVINDLPAARAAGD